MTRVFGGAGTEVRALDGVDLTLTPGSLTAVMGSSGSGESTLRNGAAGLDRPTAGTVTVAGRPLSGLDDDDLARFPAAAPGTSFVGRRRTGPPMAWNGFRRGMRERQDRIAPEEDAVTAREPQEMAQVAADTGAKKTHRTWDRVLVSAFLAGAYISFGALVAITVSSGLDPGTWGTLPTLFMGAAFTLGLVLVLIAGSDLATGNMMLVPLGAMRGKIGVGDVVRNLTLVLLGNLIGALVVAFFLAVQTDVIGHATSEGSPLLTYERLAAIAGSKTDHTAWETFLRGVGCNWLVCLAVWMSLSTTSISGKIIAIFFPVMAFVAMGFDHVVANMFFIPAAIFADVPGIGWNDALVNWLLAGVGNLVGAVVFVATSYWYLFLRDQPEKATPAAEPAERA